MDEDPLDYNPRSYLDPLGSKLPALERNILWLRAMQMVLVLFYAEQLKQRLLDLVGANRRLKALFPAAPGNRIGKVLDALIADGVLTVDEKAEIHHLIDYRNIVAHDIHVLVAGLSSDKWVRQTLHISRQRFNNYDYAAADRLRRFLDKIDNLHHTRPYIHVLRRDLGFFRTAERTFRSEIKALTRKIDKLWAHRTAEVDALNTELDLGPDELADGHPRDPGSQYDNNRLTKRGEELCYRLFDGGKSVMAVAHLTGLSLVSARKRRKMWLEAGGEGRLKVDLQSLPRYRRRR